MDTWMHSLIFYSPIGVFVGFSCIFLLRILIFKGLNARRLYMSFGVKGLNVPYLFVAYNSGCIISLNCTFKPIHFILMIKTTVTVIEWISVHKNSYWSSWNGGVVITRTYCHQNVQCGWHNTFLITASHSWRKFITTDRKWRESSTLFSTHC
jgi:hypothetical protein